MTSPVSLLLLALAAIGVLVALVTWRKWNAFLALLVAALIVGLGAGMAPLAALKPFRDGLGATLGGIAAKTGTTVARLEQLNPGIDPQALHVGQTIRVQ